MEERILYPVDTASFSRIREHSFIYVDKTRFIDKMNKEIGNFYFLARPRRFGKSLFISTLNEYFKGNRQLFKGLEIDTLQPEEWEKYPVLHFNMSGAAYLKENSLTNLISYDLDRLEKEYEIAGSELEITERFYHLIVNLATKSNKKVVILIDEYDAPLSSAIGKPELQEIYREQLHGFYSVLKKSDGYIRFCFLTGVTRYGKVSVFSGLNNLNDITFDDNYAGICGITEEELHSYYQKGVQSLAKEKGITIESAFSLLKFHYDGYHFSKSLVDVYNPFSINFALKNKDIDDYWCQSGMPTLLSKTLLENDFDIEQLNGKEVMETELSNLSMHALNPVPLFYQTGYLTIKKYDKEDQIYIVGYPNREVEKGILYNILQVYSEDRNGIASQIVRMKRSLKNGEPELFIKLFSSFLAQIPLKLRTFVAQYENYYHTIFYCIITLLGLDIDAEYATSEGYVDILIKTTEYIYVIELKINGTAEDAIQQIEKRHYCRPFESDPRRMYKIGLGFSKQTNTIESSIIL